MELEAKLHEIKKPIMVLGTSSGAGKSLTLLLFAGFLKIQEKSQYLLKVKI